MNPLKVLQSVFEIDVADGDINQDEAQDNSDKKFFIHEERPSMGEEK